MRTRLLAVPTLVLVAGGLGLHARLASDSTSDLPQRATRTASVAFYPPIQTATSAHWPPVTQRVDAIAGPTAPTDPVPPRVPVASFEPAHIPPFVVPPEVRGYTLEPMRSCPQHQPAGASVPLSVSTASGSITLTWYSAGDPDLAGYRITAAPQIARVTGSGGVPRLVWRSVAAPSGCQNVTATVGGLTVGQSVQVWIEAGTTSRVTGMTRYRMVGRSETLVVR